MKPLHTLADVLDQFSKTPKKEDAFLTWNRGNWEKVSSDDFLRMVKSLALLLKAKGLEKGDRVGIYAPSKPEWIAADLAIAIAGGVTVPFFNNLSDEHFIYEVEHAKPRFCFVAEEKNWEKVSPQKERFEELLSLDEVEVSEVDENAYQELASSVQPDDLATIIYTSGSTGQPKGVELTHKNLTSIIHVKDFRWQPEEDRFLNFLPLAHIFAKQLNLIMVAWGIRSYFINDLTKIGDAAKEVRPTFIIAVPRLLEKVYAKMLAKVNAGSFVKKLIGHWAFKVEHPLFTPLANALVYGKLRGALGGKLRLVFSGGAALEPTLHKFFLKVGVPVHQGWGMTEVSTIAVNRFDDNKIGTVGPPLGDAEFKISAEGELLVKGPTVMRGYYRNTEATANVFTSQGWFCTGDRAKIDADGHLIIEGRMDETFKTAQGEFVAPLPIEQKLVQSPLIEAAMVVGEGKRFVSCLIFPDWSVAGDRQDLEKKIAKHIRRINRKLDHWEELHDYRIIETPPTIEGGELTPTMKLRRRIVLEKYQELFEGIYE